MTLREHMALTLAGRLYRYPGAREAAIRHELGWSETRYWQVVNHLIDQAEAEAAYPTVVRRLRRLRDLRAHTRRRTT